MDVEYYVERIRLAQRRGFWRGVYVGIALNVVTTTIVVLVLH
jgi:hypothetical protein